MFLIVLFTHHSLTVVKLECLFHARKVDREQKMSSSKKDKKHHKNSPHDLGHSGTGQQMTFKNMKSVTRLFGS